jgi:hypothetical protein
MAEGDEEEQRRLSQAYTAFGDGVAPLTRSSNFQHGRETFSFDDATHYELRGDQAPGMTEAMRSVMAAYGQPAGSSAGQTQAAGQLLPAPQVQVGVPAVKLPAPSLSSPSVVSIQATPTATAVGSRRAGTPTPTEEPWSPDEPPDLPSPTAFVTLTRTPTGTAVVTSTPTPTATAGQYASLPPTATLGGTVVVRIPAWANDDEVRQLREYVERSNIAARNGQLSPTGRVRTEGTLLRSLADNAVDRERRRAETAGMPYKGVVGHVPDPTWTGQPEPPQGWLDESLKINSSIGAQSRKYDYGYHPSEFVVEDLRQDPQLSATGPNGFLLTES